MNQINFTDAVSARVAELIKEEGNPNLKLRVFVQGGGCSGFSYGFTFDEEVNHDDFTFVHGDFTMVVDSTSIQYLRGATVDYKEDLTGAAFVIDNPSAETSCGCGSSFSMSDEFEFDDFGHGY